MNRLASVIKVLLGSSTCEKLIKYDGRSLEVGALGAGYAGASFSLGSFKTNIEKVREASEAAAAMDDYQYDMCKIASEYDKDDPERRQYNRWRVAALSYFATLRITLAALNTDSSEELKNKLESLVQDMQDFVRAIAKALAPVTGGGGGWEESRTVPPPVSRTSGKYLRKRPTKLGPKPLSRKKLGPRPLSRNAALSHAYDMIGLTSEEVEKEIISQV
jgi:hypothetical protein